MIAIPEHANNPNRLPMRRLSSNDRFAAQLRTRLAPIFDAPVLPSTAPIPMSYPELVAEIERAEAFLASEPGPSLDRIAVQLRLTRLEDARTAWDKHVVSTTLASVGA